MVDEIVCQTDSDWAGDQIIRRSVSGGLLQVGGSSIKTWSKDQSVIALSSAEAELYAMNVGAAHALGMQSMLKDLGFEMSVRIQTDASATVGIVKRSGSGKLRHVDVNQLWIQEAVKNKKLVIDKIPGALNNADLGTKPLAYDAIMFIMSRIGYTWM